jgi:hypothetical protein
LPLISFITIGLAQLVPALLSGPSQK